MSEASSQPSNGDPTLGSRRKAVWFPLDMGSGLAIALASALVATGVAVGLYHRPSGNGFWAGTHPARTGLHVALASALAGAHCALAAAMVVTLALWFWRHGRQSGHDVRPLPWGWLCAVLGALITAFAVPWESYLPWSDAATVTELVPTQQSETEGPFPELIALRARYPNRDQDPAWPPHLRSQRGVVLAWVHMLIAPVALLGALFANRSRSYGKP